MSPFDLGAGLLLLISVVGGWVRGGARELAGVAALVGAAVISFLAIRVSGPIAAHFVHSPWLANLTAILAVFVVAFILLRMLLSGLARQLHDAPLLGQLVSLLGAAFGFARALVVLGLAALVIGAMNPPDKPPGWTKNSLLYPLSTACAGALEILAPEGIAFAQSLTPAMTNALSGESATNTAENRDHNDTSKTSPKMRVEPRK